MTNCKVIDDYINLVKNGKYRVCREQIQLIKFVENVFENEEIYVDEEQLEKYLALQKYFPYELFEWEKFCFALHNCTYSAPGVLRFPDLALIVGRGTGKNGYLAFEDFALLTPVNGIRNYDIDICATSEDQATITFNDIYNVLENNKAKMQKHFKWTKTRIVNVKTNSVLRYRTSNSSTKDGGRPGKVDFDEKHAYENYKLIEVFVTGLGKKPMPRTTTTTTMGNVRDGPLDQEFARGLEAIGGFECVGYCEIDKYAKQAYEAMYDTGGKLYFDDARKIIPEQLPDFDLLVGGFPCQSFSIAGARKGFDDTRGTLFFEIARISAVKKPKYLFLENVPGLLNHDSGKTFETILRTGSPKSCKLFGERRHSIADELLTACGRNE